VRGPVGHSAERFAQEREAFQERPGRHAQFGHLDVDPVPSDRLDGQVVFVDVEVLQGDVPVQEETAFPDPRRAILDGELVVLQDDLRVEIAHRADVFLRFDEAVLHHQETVQAGLPLLVGLHAQFRLHGAPGLFAVGPDVFEDGEVPVVHLQPERIVPGVLRERRVVSRPRQGQRPVPRDLISRFPHGLERGHVQDVLAPGELQPAEVVRHQSETARARGGFAFHDRFLRSPPAGDVGVHLSADVEIQVGQTGQRLGFVFPQVHVQVQRVGAHGPVHPETALLLFPDGEIVDLQQGTFPQIDGARHILDGAGSRR